MAHKPSILLLLLMIGQIPLCLSLQPPPPEQDPCYRPNTAHLRSDQLTVLINGYSPSRIPLLRSLAAAYSASPSVASVLVLWGNPSIPSQTLALLSHNLSSASSSAPISLLRQPSPSLNLRFLPRPSSMIPTLSVLICDDDVQVDPKSLQFAFQIWSQNPNRLIGFFARSHDIDLSRKGEWIYTVHPNKYSIILTKIMIMKTEYLYKYSCEGGDEMIEARAVVDKMRNCEDILMNFMAADEAGGPVLVGGERVRDWGDPRNEGGEEREVGLSRRRRDHRKRRGECIREFHRIFGRMPLSYSYGKAVDSVGEQGLCDKGGPNLVFCDHQLD